MNTLRPLGFLALYLVLFTVTAWGAPADIEPPARAEFDRADELFNANQFDAALPKFQEIRTKYKGAGAEQMASHRVALIYYASMRFDEAIREWQNLLKRFPQTPLKFESTYNMAAAQHQKKLERECYSTLMTIPPSEVEQENESRSRVYYQLAAECADAAGFPSTAVSIYDTGYGRLRARDAKVQYQNGIVASARRIKEKQEIERLASEAKNSDTRETLLAVLADPDRDLASEIEGRIGAKNDRLSFTPKLGYGRIEYQQTALSAFSQDSLGFGLNGRFQWAPQWAVAVDSTLFLHPLRFSSAASKVGYLDLVLSLEHRRDLGAGWSFAASLGPVYATLLETDNRFGFRHLSGPQMELIFGYRISDGSAVSLDLKGALFNSDASTLSTANHRYGVSLGFEQRLTDDFALTIDAEYSRLMLFFSNGTASANVITAYAGCRF